MEGTPTHREKVVLTSEEAHRRAQLTENGLRAAGTPEGSISLAVNAILKNVADRKDSPVDTKGTPVS